MIRGQKSSLGVIMGGSEPRSWVGIHSGGNGEPLLVLEERNAVLVCTVEREFWRQRGGGGLCVMSLVPALKGLRQGPL